MSSQPTHATRPAINAVELGQCKVRLLLVIAVFSWNMVWSAQTQTANASQLALIAGVYFAYSLFHWYWTYKSPEFNRGRMYIVTFADQALVIYFFALSGEMGNIYVFAGPWISIGNGLRYGTKWMGLSAAMAVIGLSLSGLFSGYLQENFILLIGLLILNLTIPGYVAILLSGLEKSRAQLVSYAEKLEKMALQDELTGLPNRTALHEELGRVCAYADRHQLSVALLYFDLDGFKTVNDTYGHTLGDSLLKEAASRVIDIVRSEDVVARLGGDEFVVLLQGQDSVQRAQRVAERILHAVFTIDSIGGSPINVSASLGGIVIEGCKAAHFNAEYLLHEADKNMYQAKREGKNRIVLTGLSEEVDVTLVPVRSHTL